MTARLVGWVAVLAAAAGAVVGLGSYVLYTADLVNADTSASLILVSLLCSLVALPIGFAGSRWTRKRDQDPDLAQAGMILAAGTLGVWLVVVAVALGK